VPLSGLPERSRVACGSLEPSSLTQLEHSPAEVKVQVSVTW
jgi:hypothetical protein